MLSVCVEVHDDPSALCQCERGTRLQSGALAEIDNVAQVLDRKGACHGWSFVGRSVIDEDEVTPAFTQNILNRRCQHRAFVERGNDNEHAVEHLEPQKRLQVDRAANQTIWLTWPNSENFGRE